MSAAPGVSSRPVNPPIYYGAAMMDDPKPLSELRNRVQQQEIEMSATVIEATSPTYAFDLGYRAAEAGESRESPFSSGSLTVQFFHGWDHYQGEMAGAITPYQPTRGAAD